MVTLLMNKLKAHVILYTNVPIYIYIYISSHIYMYIQCRSKDTCKIVNLEFSSENRHGIAIATNILQISNTQQKAATSSKHCHNGTTHTVEPRLSEPRLSELSIIRTGADK